MRAAWLCQAELNPSRHPVMSMSLRGLVISETLSRSITTAMERYHSSMGASITLVILSLFCIICSLLKRPLWSMSSRHVCASCATR